MQLVNYRRNQEALMQTPPSVSQALTTDTDAARAMIRIALEEKREWLSEMEAKSVLSAYGIPVVQTMVARAATKPRVLPTRSVFR